MRHRGFAGLVFATVVLLEATAAADVRVLVFTPEGEPSRPMFTEALRIQLADIATVVDGGALPSGSLADRVDHAAAAVAATGGTFALWLEEGGAGDFVLHVVGRRAGRAVVEIVRMPPAVEGPETDRALAIKARDVIEGILAPAADEDPVRALRPGRPAARGRLAYGLEVGIVATGGATDAQGGFGIGAAVRFGSHVDLELYAAARFMSEVGTAAAAGDVDLAEQDLAAGLRVLGPGRVRLGGTIEAGARWLHAEGTTDGGAMGTASELVPVLSAGPEARLRLRPGVELRAGLAAELAARRQRFALNDVPVLDVGRWRAVGTLALVVTWP